MATTVAGVTGIAVGSWSMPEVTDEADDDDASPEEDSD